MGGQEDAESFDTDGHRWSCYCHAILLLIGWLRRVQRKAASVVLGVPTPGGPGLRHRWFCCSPEFSPGVAKDLQLRLPLLSRPPNSLPQFRLMSGVLCGAAPCSSWFLGASCIIRVLGICLSPCYERLPLLAKSQMRPVCICLIFDSVAIRESMR